MISSQLKFKKVHNITYCQTLLDSKKHTNLKQSTLIQTPKNASLVYMDFPQKITLRKKKTLNSKKDSKLSNLTKVSFETNFVKELAENKKNYTIWQQYLKNQHYWIEQSGYLSLIQHKISDLIIQKVYSALYPNFQCLNQKIFKLYIHRARKILQFKLQPLFLQDSIKTIENTLSFYFSESYFFNISDFKFENPVLIKNIEYILMAFCIHRLDIGFIQESIHLTIVLFSLFNKNTITVFNNLCNILTSKPIFSIISKNKKQISLIQSKFEQKLQNSSTILYVILIKKYNIPLKSYLHQWLSTCFMSICFQKNINQLDYLFNQNYIKFRQDTLIDKIFNFLFLSKFSIEGFIKISIAIIISIEKSLIKNSLNRDNMFNILNKPREHINGQIFSDCIFNRKL